MRFFARRRGLAFAALSLGSCFALTNCSNDLSLFPLRVAFTSFTLPVNEALLALFNLISAGVTQAVAGS